MSSKSTIAQGNWFQILPLASFLRNENKIRCAGAWHFLECLAPGVPQVIESSFLSKWEVNQVTLFIDDANSGVGLGEDLAYMLADQVIDGLDI